MVGVSEIQRPRAGSRGTKRTAPTQAQRVAHSREKLLRAATELFAVQGFGATTAGEIAERAGFVRSMVNTRFGSKDGLLATMLDNFWIDELLAETPKAANGLDAVLRVVARLEAFINEQPTRLRAFLVVSFEAAGPSAIPLQRVSEPLFELQQALANAIRAGKADGSIRQETDADFAAERVVDVGLGMAYRWLIDPQQYNFSQRVRAWRTELARTLGPDPREQ